MNNLYFKVLTTVGFYTAIYAVDVITADTSML